MNILKIASVALIGLVISINGFGQQSQVYSAAYKYLKKQNSKNNLIVSDSLIYPDITVFFNELSTEWHRKPKAVLFFLDSLGRAESKKPAIYQPFNFKSSKRNDTTKIVYFSVVQREMLLAEVVEEDPKRNRSYNNQRDFGQSTIFLFMLDKKQRIRTVYKQIIAYN